VAQAQTLNLPELLALVGPRVRSADADDPYRLLAQLPANVFVTANPDNLLQQALRAEDKEPDTVYFNWRGREYERWDKRWDEDTDLDPRYPLVFHIFGSFGDVENSLVLTEDDYFDFLLSLSEYKARIPGVVSRQLTSTSLLFLGFQLTDWNFRVLNRLIMGQQGSSKLRNHPHVGVQLDSQEETLINPRAARAYLAEYFGKSGVEAVNIFWGTAGEFLKELHDKLESLDVAVPAKRALGANAWR
jgi:hypothetical protein